MKAIYIHGLHSNPNPQKVALLEEAGLEVVAPEIDYDTEQEKVFPRIRKLILEERVEVLVGSSMGGFVAYWLARELNKPALLFNPALHFENIQIFIPTLTSSHKPPLFICSGEQDKTIDPVLLRSYLLERHPLMENIKLISASWLAHGIDLKTFQSMTAWFLADLNA